MTFWLASVNVAWGLICNFQSLGVDVYCVQETQFNDCDHKDILSRRFSLSMFWWALKRCWLASEHVFKCDVFLFSQMWWADFVCWILPLFHWGIIAGWPCDMNGSLSNCSRTKKTLQGAKKQSDGREGNNLQWWYGSTSKNIMKCLDKACTWWHTMWNCSYAKKPKVRSMVAEIFKRCEKIFKMMWKNIKK